MDEKKGKIADMAGSVAVAQGVTVVDIEFAGNIRRPTIRVFIDRSGGVTLDECERFSRALSAVFDVEDPIASSYVLEVSSPGLDRPLKRLSDFETCTGKLARVITKEKVSERTFFIGRIVGVKDDVVTLLVDGEEEIRIPFSKVSKARLEIELK